MRTRLAIVLATVMIGPLVAAWLAIGVGVPTVSRSAQRAALDRSAGAVASALAGRCQAVGEVARSVAQQVATGVLAAGGQAAGAQAVRDAAVDAAVGAARRRPGTAVAVLAGGRVLAAAGEPDARGADPAVLARRAAGASCARGTAPGNGPPALAETVPVVVGGRVVASAVVWLPVDDAALAGLRQELGITHDLVLLAAPVGPGTTDAASRRSVAAATVPRAGLGPVLAALAPGGQAPTAGTTTGTAAGTRYAARSGLLGVPYVVVALTRIPGQGLQVTLAMVLLAGALAALGLVGVLSARLTSRLVELTRTAERLGAGELGARSGIEGADEVGRLAGAIDAMAAELQTRVVEVERSRDALADTFERFGEALGRTHDLDGLLRTIAEAALRGTDAVVATALLGDGTGLEERVCASDPAALPAAADPAGFVEEAALGLTRLARAAVAAAGVVRESTVAGLGPAVALPMCREGRVVGALTVARARGAPGFDDTSLAAVGSLAAHAGIAVGNVLAHEETRRLSVTDPLTGVGNMRQLSTTLSREVERASRFTHPLSVLMLDLDHFKQVNDGHGHAFGDVVLREFARRLTDCVREVDTVARYGGEEFAVVLPETDADGATRVAERVLQAMRAQPFGGHADRQGQPQELTVSIGVAAFPVHGRGAAELIRSADAALYAAKRTGRDRWCLAGSAGDARAVPQAG